MAKLEPPDAFALSAALGWIELGNPTEALAELERVTPDNQSHHGVLELRWAALADLKRWVHAFAVASDLVRVNPNSVTGWLHRAYALRRMPEGGIQLAWDALLPAAERFKKEPVVAFNLACYACQLQRLDEARVWFERAMKTGKREEIQSMALADEDLKPLWPEIRSRLKEQS